MISNGNLRSKRFLKMLHRAARRGDIEGIQRFVQTAYAHGRPVRSFSMPIVVRNGFLRQALSTNSIPTE